MLSLARSNCRYEIVIELSNTVQMTVSLQRGVYSTNDKNSMYSAKNSPVQSGSTHLPWNSSLFCYQGLWPDDHQTKCKRFVN